MDQLLQLYTELLRGATDDQIVSHLTNFVQDSVALADAVSAVVNQARARVQVPAIPSIPEAQ